MARELDFVPFPFLSNPHWQTIVAACPVIREGPPSETQYVALDDGDQLAVEISTPEGWQPSDRSIVMGHGLTGNQNSPYLVRLARKFLRRGWRVCRMNMRGCGTGSGLARKPYHAGLSSDIHRVIETLHVQSPQSPIIVIGFSMSGNLVLKFAGEMHPALEEVVRHVIAICPAVNLNESSRRIKLPENKFYERMFVKELRRELQEREAHFPELPRTYLPEGISVYDFDELYTAPQWGYSCAEEYYARASSHDAIPNIRVPCHILFARDDPLIDHIVLDDLDLEPHIRVWKASGGGHMGFLGSPVHGHSFRWMDDLLLRWCMHLT